jgi:hypothetical protein
VTIAGSPWLQTHSGRAWCADAPRDYRYDIQEIAFALSHINRFCGHVGTYSVAEHSVRVAGHVEALDCVVASIVRAALIHDAHEFALQDIPSPLKAMPAMAGYRELVEATDVAIYAHFGLGQFRKHPAIREADLAMLAAERRDLLGDELADEWQWLPEPACEAIVPWSPAKAEREFLAAWRRYGGEL